MAPTRARRQSHWAVLVVLLAGLATYAVVTPADPVGEPAQPADPAPTDELAVHFLDVGQGDATLLVAPDATVLVDAGRHDRDDLLGHLRALDVTDLDVVAVTHPHADHLGQFDTVLDELGVAEVWWPGTTHDTRTFERAVEALERSDAAYDEPRTGDTTAVGSLVVQVLHPAHLMGDPHADNLVLRVSYGDVSFLFTGDAEAEVEDGLVAEFGAALASDVYQVGHHGSATSTTAGFLDVVRPDIAVYSAGADNPYGHPHAEVVDRIDGAGIELYGTDRHGTVTVTTDGTTLQVHTERDETAAARACHRERSHCGA